MAELFLAREKGIAGLERMVVIKRILPHLATQASFVEMFLREARIAARLNHPNIVQIYELDEFDGSYYIAMEYIHGSTVRELQILAGERGEKFPLEVSLSMFDQAARGLHTAHEASDIEGRPLGLVHRDVSPHNLMVTTEGNVKLLDFGVAKATEGVDSTYSGNLKGKFAYMSPEQCMRTGLDRRSDVFSLGIVLWELLVGQRLFKRSNELEMMQAIINGDVARPSAMGRKLPLELEDAVMKALSVDRERRFQTVEALRQTIIEVARAEGYDIGSDRIAKFVKTIAGEQLHSRNQTLQAALERSLTSGESADLLHRTGSQSQDAADTKIDKSLVAAIRDGTLDREAENYRARHESGSDSVSYLPTDSVEHGGKSGPRTSVSPDRSAETVIDRRSDSIRDVDELIERPELRSPDPDIPDETTTGRSTETKPGDHEREPARHVGDSDAKPQKRSLWFHAIWISVLAIGVTLGVAIFTSPEPPDEAGTVLLGKPMRIGWAPTIETDQLKQEVAPLHKYLEGEIGRPLPIVVPESYDALSDALVAGETDFAVLPPLLYLKTREKDPEIKPLVFKAFDGATKSDGYILVRMESDFNALADLEGKTFCLTNPSSTTGYLLPRAHIRQNGYDPDEFIGKIHWSREHLQVMRDLLKEKCDAAATYSGALITGQEVEIKTGRLRTLAITGNIPQDVVAGGSHVSRHDREQLTRALIAFDPNTLLGQPTLGETQRIESFLQASDADYQALEKAVRAERESTQKSRAEDRE